jgi:nucleotide-binding universal stress UspA family protein
MPQDVLPNSATNLTTTSQEAAPPATEEDALTFKRILVPIDFSEHSKKTVSCAINLASRDNAKVQLLHVFQIADYVVTPFARRNQQTDQVKSQIDAAEQEARERLAAFEQQVQNRGIKVEAYIRVGYPFDEIVAMAEHFDVDLIVIGSHGCSGITRLLVGSTAERVVEHASCSVLVVKDRRIRTP